LNGNQQIPNKNERRSNFSPICKAKTLKSIFLISSNFKNVTVASSPTTMRSSPIGAEALQLQPPTMRGGEVARMKGRAGPMAEARQTEHG
jgi:hypothetical protein